MPETASGSGLPRVESADELARGAFLALRRLRWRDAGGVERMWESAERTADFGAVAVIARLLPSDRVVLIRQFRPPARGFVYELPAGLVDPGETPERAALRELREETGYTARTIRVGPAGYSSAGMSDEKIRLATAEIDENAPENTALQTEFDPAENIETILVPRSGLAAFYRAESARGNAFDTRIAAYVLGME